MRKDTVEIRRQDLIGDSIRSFHISVKQKEIDDLKTRLSLTRFPQKELVEDWEQGIPLSYVKALTTYWQETYDWRRCERALNALPNYLVCLLYTSPSPRDQRGSRMPSSA